MSCSVSKACNSFLIGPARCVNQIFAAFHAALRATVPAELADLMTAPFSWHRATELKAAAEEAGFREVRLLSRSLPMVFEKGLEQAVQAFSATPVSPGVAALSQSVQDAFYTRLQRVAKDRHCVDSLLLADST